MSHELGIQGFRKSNSKSYHVPGDRRQAASRATFVSLRKTYLTQPFLRAKGIRRLDGQRVYGQTVSSLSGNRKYPVRLGNHRRWITPYPYPYITQLR